MNVTVTISIGRNYGQATTLTGPMSPSRWGRFISRTDAIVAAACTRGFLDVHFSAVGEGWYEGQPEESYTIIATVPSDKLSELQARLSYLARIFGQDSIAVTAGQTTIVEAR